jgi:hypothetical protein
MPLLKREPIDVNALSLFMSQINFKPPVDYMRFMSASNGAEGSLGDNYYIILYPIEELVEHNKDYQVDDYAPGLFIIGSDGGGMAFAFDKNTGEFYEMPFIGMSREEATFLAEDFDSFIEFLQK